MEVTIAVCNVCQDPSRPVLRYSIQQMERSVTVDLCEQDSSALERLLSGNEVATTPAISTPVRVAAKVAAPKATAKATAKKAATDGPRTRRGSRIQETKIEDIK